jgi:RNA polymerase sigma factor (sigma-70 family)
VEVRLMSGDETVLLRQFAQTRDAEAFSEITRRYAGMVYGVCLRVTGDPERARDATQDTFLQLLKQAGQVAGSLGGWLHRVATRRAVDLVRRDSARRQRERAYAADAVWETDVWADISPLVDEAMNEIEPDQRELLLRHFLQGQTTVQMAADEGVSQPTLSRRVEGALEQLRERLRKKGVGVAAAVLGTMMAGAAQEAPAAVLSELGKMSLATAGTASATVLSLKAKLAIAAAIALAGAGGYVSYKATRPAESAPPRMARGGAMIGGGPAVGRAVVAGGAGQSMGFGGLGMGGTGPSLMATPRDALTRFTALLLQGDPARTTNCFAGTTEAELFQRWWANPADEKERNLQQALRSLIPPVEVLGTNSLDDGLKIRWTAQVRQPFTQTEAGPARTWQTGERFELETRLKQVDAEWKIVGF